MKNIYTLGFLLFGLTIGFSQDRESDSLALVSIYQSLNGNNWPKNENWLSDQPLDEWEGVRMKNDRVDDFELKSNASANIAGDFPLQVLELTELTTLEISNVDISGPIPESLIQLSKLDRIVLSSCNLNGELPPIFDQFPNLRTLVLSFNDITGPLPALPQGMSLAYVDRNQFSGPIPESWAGNTISAIQIHGNNLSGNYDIITTMPNISSINLSDNNWDESTLPLWIDDIPNLDRFTCNNCNLIGDIPAELDFSALQSYSGMFLSDNDLTGDITPLFNNPEYGQQMYMRLRNNKLSGELPIDKIESFFQLDVYNNQYSSMTSPLEGTSYTLDIQFNDFNYEAISPVQEYIELDSIIGVKYWNQNDIGLPDTLAITTSQDITLNSYDSHPNTEYQWYKDFQAIEGETDSDLNISVTDNSSDGKYQCRMTNESFPELDLRTSTTVLEVDISTNTENIVFRDLTLAPNPTADFFEIRGLENDIYKYNISNSIGSRITSDQNLNSGIIDVNSLDAGVYFINIKSESARTSIKFIKI